MKKKGLEKFSIIFMWVLLILFFISFTAHAAVPQKVSYQGYLTDSGGNPVNGPVSIVFYIYNVNAGGAALWSETQSVAVNNGIYSVILGSVTPINLQFNEQYYLGVKVGADAEMTPRQALTSTPYSIRAEKANDADTVDGSHATAFATSSHSHTETDPQVGTLTNAKWCTSDGSMVNCTSNAPLLTETDPTVNTLGKASLSCASGQVAKWNGTAWACAADAGLTSETDPQVGTLTSNLWCASNAGGTAINCSQPAPTALSGWTDDGTSVRLTTVTDNVGIGVSIPQSKLHVAGDIRLNSGGAFTSISTGNNTRLDLYSNTSAADSSSWIELWGNDATRAGELTLAGTYVDMRYGSNDAGIGNVGIRLTSDGNVGIGTTDPTAKLEVNGLLADGKLGAGLYGVLGESSYSHGVGVGGFSASSNGYGVYGSNVGGYAGYFHGNGYFSGNVGIGTEDADEKLTIRGGNIIVKNATGSKSLRLRTTGDLLDMDVSGANLYVNGDGGNIMFINNTQKNVGIGTTGTGNHRLVVSGIPSENAWSWDYSAGYFSHSWQGHIGRAYLAIGDIGVKGEGSNVGVKGEGSIGVVGYATYGGSAFYAANGTYDPFTGAHEAKLSDDFPQNIRHGMIVSVTGQAQTRQDEGGKVSVASTLPTVRLSDRVNDKTVFGVLARQAPLPSRHWYKPEEGERFATVNALGDGRVWVSNVNGNIKAGDYITTSDIPGYGQRQDDDLLHSYTLGKAIETVDWDAVTETVEYNGQKFKVYLIGVVYTSG